MKQIFNIVRYAIIVAAIIFCTDTFSMNMDFQKQKKIAVGLKNFKQSQIKKLNQLHLDQLRNLRQGFLMFLDNTEKEEIDAVSSGLVTALYQEAGPIIVSNSLLSLVLKEREKDKRSIDKQLNELVDINIKNREKSSFYNSALISRISFQPKLWIIKEAIPYYLSILIPKKRFTESDISNIQACHGYAAELSDTELKLGLKVNHMETITHKNLKELNLSPSDYFADSLEYIFCTKNDYKDKNIVIPRSFIFMHGHGGENKEIAGLSIEEAKKTLEFYDKEINTEMLCVLSCDVAGKNNKKLFNKRRFPVIVHALNDINTCSTVPRVDIQAWRNKQEITVKTEKNFSIFLENLKGFTGNYHEVIKPINTRHIHNIAQIKLPSEECFTVMDLHKDIVTIDSTLSKKELLNIDVLAQKHPRVLLLYAPYVTGELVINQDKLEDIISMEDDNNRINKISTSRKFIDILKLFKTVGAYSGKKMFLIDQCKDNKDVIISNPKDDIVRAYFKDEKGNKEMADFYDKRNNQEIKFQPIGHYAQDYENKLKLLQNHVYKV